MVPYEYDSMENNVCYYATTSIGGSCVIKKTAETIPYGEVRARFMDGRHIERHFAFFNLGDKADPEDRF